MYVCWQLIFSIYGISGGTVQISNIINLKFVSRNGVYLNNVTKPFNFIDMNYTKMIKRLLSSIDIKLNHVVESNERETKSNRAGQ